jgi:pimeloyl-ACP methyl ester carboxylesterase
MTEASTSFATNGPVELYYESFGEPGDDTLLLVNGLGSQCINYDVAFCQMFVERGFFVIRFDNRDVGLSSKLEEFTPRLGDVATAVREGKEVRVPYRLSDMADDCVAVLDAHGVARTHVLGVSMGGMIVQQLAIDHATRLRSMTSIMSTTGDTDVGKSSPEVAVLFNTPPGEDRETVIARAQALQRLYTSPTEYDEDRVAQRVGDAFDRCFCPKGVTRQLAAIIASGSRTQSLTSIDVPTLVIHGEADTLVDVSGGVRTAQCIPGAQFISIPGMGHDLAPCYWGTIVDAATGLARAASDTPNG